ncbi:hypothetical protein DNTS_035477 [Danionella cerebrum]|uniref:Macrophage mannose receptor 1 n=1 Tax=Danionella cerebrum TaxID=2873325 RepID=A0A553R664_9TELE|nr:hypothetical protein DNTS_035477 [Danionella translucida]
MKITLVALLLVLDLSTCFAQSGESFLIYNVELNRCLAWDYMERLTHCDPFSHRQLFRWISKNRILNTNTKTCLGAGSKSVGRKMQLLRCDDSDLQKWECHGDGLLGLKNETLYLSTDDSDYLQLSKDTGKRSKWTIHGTQNSICSRPYKEMYTIDGNAFGQPCNFPFLYKNTWYADCTTADKPNKRLWCATETDYSLKERWGYCPTRQNTYWVKHPLTNIYYQLNGRSTLTWYQARMSCQQQGAELLSVVEPHEHTFVAGLVQRSQGSLWIGLNMLDTSSGWQWTNGQPLRYLKWLSVIDTGYCQSPWIPYSGSCYLLHRVKKSWRDARETCLREGGDLISILNVEEQSFAITQLGYMKIDVLWIGFNDRKTQMFFEWSDQSSVQFVAWDVGEPTHSALHPEDCVLMRGEEGKWADEICEKKFGFICEKKTSSKASNNDTIVTNPGCQTGWSRYGYYCYTAGSETKTFDEAKQACKKAESHLVDISSRVENAFLVSLVGARPETHFWIGLSSQKDRHSFEWTNSKHVPFTHFNTGMPGRTQGCVAMITGIVAGVWDVLSCSNKEKYICKQKADGVVTTPAPPTTPSLTCPEEWSLIGTRDYCVKHFNVPMLQMKTWDEALNFCQELGGDLLSIQYESDIPWKQGGGYPSWIGYRMYDPLVGFVWSDGSPSSYQSWATDEPNNLNNMENCVEMRVSLWDDDGLWNDVNCNDKKDWYCQIRKGKTPKEVNISETVYNKTEDGWTEFKGSQYFVVKFSAMSMHEARAFCKRKHGDLVTINDEEERIFIWHKCKESYSSLIIGLLVDFDGTYQWMDGSPVVFEAWEANQPAFTNSDERCAKMTSSQGLWETINCGDEYNFVCKRSESPSVNSTVAPTPNPKGGCAPGWIHFKRKCYNVREETKTWMEARKHCRDLAFLTTQIRDTSVDLWIGFNNLANQRFKWTDGSGVSFTEWANGEPHSTPNWRSQFWTIYHYLDRKECVLLSNSNFGKWVATDCNSTNGFICNRDIGIPPTPPIQHPGHCPEQVEDSPMRWIPFKDSCYAFVTNMKSWSRAARICMTWGATLVSIRDEPEQTFIESNLLLLESYKEFWIGLLNNHKGNWFWLDRSVVDYTNWASESDYEDDYEGHSWNPDCALISATHKKWKKRNCEYTILPFICKTAKEVITTTETPHKGLEAHSTNTGLAVFLTIAILGIFGALAYVYHRKARHWLMPAFENPMYNNTDSDHADKDNKTLLGQIEIVE